MPKKLNPSGPFPCMSALNLFDISLHEVQSSRFGHHNNIHARYALSQNQGFSCSPFVQSHPRPRSSKPPLPSSCINAREAQRNRKVYGQDVDVFRPKRWLIEDQERLCKMEKVQGLVFSYENTKCLGIPIAPMNLNKVFVEACLPRDSICRYPPDFPAIPKTRR